jgi:periplasmic protein TonB
MKKILNITAAVALLTGAGGVYADAKDMPVNGNPEKASINVGECKAPAYPLESVRNEETGVVVMQFLVGTDGKVLNAKIVRSSGFRNLDTAALEFLSRCNKFKPGVVDGNRVESWVTVSYEWKIE